LSDWDPATEAEAAMRDALLASDQELYFQILARSELVLPVSPEALAGRAPMGWGTWTTSNRTHVLAFTSPAALYACLNEPGATYRTMPFATLASGWPNYEWWLAVNPGLPIEAYLPSWFVAQLTRGDVRLPGRTMGAARARMTQSDLAAAINGRVRASAPAQTVTSPVQASAAVPPGPVTAPAEGLNGRGHGHAVETVDAEIIDYPPASGSARVYGTRTGVVVEPVPERDRAGDAGPGRSGGGFLREPESRGGPFPGGAFPGGSFTSSAYAGGAVYTPPPSPTPPPPPPPTSTTTRTGGRPSAGREAQDAEIVTPPAFVPANETESNLFAAAEENNTDAFLSTLLLARVILPVPPGTSPSARPRERDFPWQMEQKDGKAYVVVFTSPQRLSEHSTFRHASSVSVKFVELIATWPGEEISFSINPGSPVGATLPGSQIVALATWATDVGLRDDPVPSADVAVVPKRTEPASSVGVAGAATVVTVMQRTVPPAQLPFYLERGYDRVSGFVNRVSEVSHLTSPRSLYRALGLVYPGSPYSDDDEEVHVVRWVAHRTDLYRLPYGGQHEAAMRAMQGWVIERPPFRGNGFAPGDSEVVSEFKVDSVRLPHGAQMWRLAKEGGETLVATFDADTSRWIAAGYGGTRA
jgi:hypothetical protein